MLTSSLELAVAEVFTPRSLANAQTQGILLFPRELVSEHSRAQPSRTWYSAHARPPGKLSSWPLPLKQTT